MSCNCNKSSCKECGARCKCPRPQFGVEQLPDNVSVLRYTLDGLRSDYDYTNLVYQTQTDTTLVADIIARVLRYAAERHTDTLTAQELGAILHLADLGDVDTKSAVNGSMLRYQKSSNCGEGCVGTTDKWVAWNPLDEQVSSATYPMAITADGTPVTIQRPQNPNRQYLLGWDGAKQLTYITVTKAAAKPATGGPVYFDESTGGLVYVEQ